MKKLEGIYYQTPMTAMAKEDLLKRLALRQKKDQALDDLELHQLELELQNRQLSESYSRLEDASRKFQDLYELAPVGYLSLSPEGKILRLNKRAQDLFKSSKAALLTKPLSKFIDLNFKPSFQDYLQRSSQLRAGEQLKVELILAGHLVELTSAVIVESEVPGPLILVTINDLSLKIKAETLEKELELRENFVSALSHDLRSPLTSSKLCAQMLKNLKKDGLGEKEQRLFTLLLEELERADRMILDLLNAKKIRKDHDAPLEKIKCSMDRIARKCIQSILSIHGDAVRINYKTSGEIMGYWSKDEVYRILENLLMNAMKYGASDLPVSVALEGTLKLVKITVHNFGNPIGPLEQKKIFDAYFRSRTTPEHSTGWGLGLDLVNNLVKRHGGEIKLTSNLKDGTSFQVILPKNT
jgi:signal transduction histidine kinase